MLRAPDQPPRATLTTGARAAVPGVTLSTVNPAVMAEYDLPLSAQGVLVEDPGDVGARAGLRAGDVLLAINGAAVTDSASAEAALEAAERRLALDIQRGQRRLTMRFRL
jgi:S1-C subfamily serine protease